MPGKGGVTRDDHSPARKAELDARDARLRGQVEAGTFGLAQLFPGGMTVDARRLPPLPRPSAVPLPVVPAPVARSKAPEEETVQLAFSTLAAEPDTCVYKPVMSDADIDACR